MARVLKIPSADAMKPSPKALEIIRDKAADNGERIHIVSSGEKWAVKKEGAARATRVLSSKKEAVKVAKTIALNGSTRSIISHKRDGTFIRIKVS